MVLEALARNLQKTDIRKFGSDEEFTKIWKEMLEEIRMGVSIEFDSYVVLGRKALNSLE